MDVVKPLLKWVGGKTQIIDKILSEFPTYIKNYHEPFVGGGSVLLGFLTLVYEGSIKVDGEIYASDKNVNLINMYKNIRDKPDEVIEALNNLLEEFKNLKFDTGLEKPNRSSKNKAEALQCQESYYYYIREVFNTFQETERNTPKASAHFIFLNKTCFRGVYREGPKGFNVPFGHYKNPSIYNEEDILIVSSLLQNVVFSTQSFEKSFEKVEENDFLYIDPPYAPENTTSFVSYTNDGFNTNSHTKLFSLCNSISTIPNVKFLMSNANVKFVKEHFQDDKYVIDIITCKRAINSKNPSAKAEEILIKCK
jgi:DNA adenine methylase